MPTPKTNRTPKLNRLAYLRGEERGTRFTYRHTPAGAARKLRIPEEWIWWWIANNLLKTQMWLRKTWIRLEDVQALCTDPRRWMRRFVPVLPTEPISPERMREIEVELSRLEVNKLVHG
jgi:hypothetical protein